MSFPGDARLGAAFATILMLFTAPCASAAAPKITIKFSMVGQINLEPVKSSAGVMVADIERKSGGRVTFDTYGSGSAFAVPGQLVTQVERGISDMAFGPFDAVPGRFPRTELLGLPFMVHDSVAASRAVMTVYRKYLAADFPTVHVISIILTTPRQLHTRVPVTKLGDIKGLRILNNIPSLTEVLRPLGAEVAALPNAEQYEDLERGTIDGFTATWSSLISFRSIEVTRYHLVANFAASPLFLIMNKAKYASLPPDIKALFDAWSTPQAAGELAAAWVKTDEAAIADVKKRKQVITPVSAKEDQRLREIAKPVIARILDKDEAAGVPARAVYAGLTAAIARQERNR